MRVYLDTNVFLDLLLDRPEGADDAEKVLARCARGELQGAFNTLSACNIAYVMRKYVGQVIAEAELAKICGYIELVSTTTDNVRDNLCAVHADFEDSVQISCAKAWGADVIVTRDKEGFVDSPIMVMTPAELLRHQPTN